MLKYQTLSNPDLVKATRQQEPPLSHWHLANHHESHSYSHVMLDGHPFSMSISRLITMSRLRYPSRRTGMLGFEGNGTFQSHFFSLLHTLELAMDWTLGDSSSKILCSLRSQSVNLFFPILCHHRPMSSAIRPRHTRFTRRGGIRTQGIPPCVLYSTPHPSCSTET